MPNAEYLAYLQTDHWAELKIKLYRRRGKKCMACDSGHKVDAHHVRYRHPLTTCTEDDLMPLCRRCHDVTHDNPQLHLDSQELETNDQRRLHLILGIRSILKITVPIPRAEIRPALARHLPRQKRRRHGRKKKHHYPDPPAPAPGSPAAIYAKNMIYLRSQRQAEDRERVNSALKNSTERKRTVAEEQEIRRIESFNRNGHNVKPTTYY